MSYNIHVSCHVVREELKDLTKDFDHSEEDLKSLQSGVGQIVGEVLRQLTEEKCEGYSEIHSDSTACRRVWLSFFDK